MKITKTQLKRMIKEEFAKVTQEAREMPPWLKKPQKKREQRPALHIPPPRPPSSPKNRDKPASTKVDYRLEELDGEEPTRRYFWSCVGHDMDRQPATDMDDARKQLEAHEKEAHKGKQVGSFGFEVVRSGQ
jgi:hypothetical protein